MTSSALASPKATLAVMGARAHGARLERMQSSPRFRGGRFWNTAAGVMERSPPVGLIGEYFRNGAARIPHKPLPLITDTVARLRADVVDELRVTWLGHSTVIVEIDGVRLLTDPVFGTHASPSSLFGPKRFHAPPVAIDALPPIDAVVLSHDHYDHLCMPSVLALARGASGFTGPFVMPLGVGAHLQSWGIPAHRIHERDWDESFVVVGANGNEVELTATPAQHFSGRGPRDRFTTLWCGWAMKGKNRRVFFSGDTGFTPEFADIGKKHGPFDVAMFEIGAFHPAWGDIHLGPDNAAAAFQAIGARALLPVHWSTFNLALHAWHEPMETLWTRSERESLRVMAPLIGEPIAPTANEGFAPWWRDIVG